MAKQPTGSGKRQAGAAGKRPSKQAVVIIHGMGEQRPMETLRDFVRAIWMDDYEFCRVTTGGLNAEAKLSAEEAREEVEKKLLGKGTWITPVTGRLAETGVVHENIRITTDYHQSGDHLVREGDEARTDFYEFYWADLMNSSAGSALRRWTAGLFLRPLSTVPREVYALWVALWVLLVVMALLFLLALPSVLPIPAAWTDAFLPGLKKYIYETVQSVWPDNPLVALAILAALPAANLVRVLVRDWWLAPDKRSASAFLPVLLFHLGLIALIVALVAGCAWLVDKEFVKAETLFWSALTGVALLIGVFVNQFYIPYFGDVARYVQSATDTVRQREAIRDRGLALLRQLHDNQEYSRIVIASHSLGSVIAYDLIRLLWNEYGPTSTGGLPLTEEMQEAFHAVADAAPGRGDRMAPISEFQRYRAAQKRAFVALRGSQLQALAAGDRDQRIWKISDLVTFGSPLTHADFLMASDRDHLDALQAERSLPRNPPIAETGVNRVVNPSGNDTYLYRVGSEGSGAVFAHHGAPFAVIRWTNLYDWRRWALFGDFVSGPVAGKFGRGVFDFHVRIKRLSRRFFENHIVTHTLYWEQWSSGETAKNEDAIYGRKRHVVGSSVADRRHRAVEAGSVGKEPIHLRLLRAAVDLRFGTDTLCDTETMFGVDPAEADADPPRVRGIQPSYAKGDFLSALTPRVLVLAVAGVSLWAIAYLVVSFWP